MTAPLEAMMARAESLGVFSPTAVRLIGLTQRPNARIDDFARLAARDPALASRMLKYANSPLFGLTRQISDLPTALRVLGFNGIRDLAMALSMGQLIDDLGERGRLVWEHALWTRGIAPQVAGQLRLLSRPEASLLGLVHDLGLILLMALEPALYDEVDHIIDPFDADGLVRLERRHLGVDHAELGGTLLQHWGLPTPIAMAVKHHHAPHTQLPGALLLRVTERLDHLLAHGFLDELVLQKAITSESVLQVADVDAQALARWLVRAGEARPSAQEQAAAV